MNIKLSLVSTVACAFMVLHANRAQVWTQEDASFKIDDAPLAFNVSQENRIGTAASEDGKKHIDEIHFSPTLWYASTAWLDVGINDRLVLLRDRSGTRYKTDHRPGIDVKVKETWCDWSFSNRSRFIFRQVEHEHEYFRYRNLSRIDMPWRVTQLDIRPYASYEWYFDEGCKERRYRTCDKFSIQWMIAGVTFKLSKHLRGDFHYMLTETRDRTSGKWCPGHVIGVGVSASF